MEGDPNRAGPGGADNGDEVPLMGGPPGPEVEIDGRRYLYFGGTGYLGLAGHPEVVEASCAAVRRYGVHPATSRSGFGTVAPTLELERGAAAFFKAEAAFSFASGFLSCAALTAHLEGKFDRVFTDANLHYSGRLAVRSSGRPAHGFPSRDPGGLRAAMEESLRPGERALVLTDGVFPATGQLAPLDRYFDVLADFPGGALLVDDAHGFGVVGGCGRGTVEHFGLERLGVNDGGGGGDGAPALWVGGTLSKALGGFGGIVAGGREAVRGVREASHLHGGASALPAPVAAAAAKALEIVAREPERRLRARAHAARARAGLRALGIEVGDDPTPVVGFTAGDGAAMRRIHLELRQGGILLPHLPDYSGVGPGGLLRLAVCSEHSGAQIDQLVEALRAAL